VPVIDLYERHTRDLPKVQPYIPFDELVNSVSANYRGPDTLYQTLPAPTFVDAVLVEEDGQEKWGEIELPFTDNAAAVQRLQYIYAGHNRRQARISLKLSLRGFGIKGGNWFTWTDETRGWNQKTFFAEEVDTHTEEDPNGVPIFVIDVEGKEIDAGIWPLNVVDQPVNVPELSDLRSSSVPLAPTWLEPDIAFDRDVPSVTLNLATPSGGGDVTYVFRYRKSGAIAWEPILGSSERAFVLSLEPGAYDVEARALSVPMMIPSPWTPDVLTVGPPPLVGEVLALELAGQGSNRIFEGPDAVIDWIRGSVNAPGLDDPDGADVFDGDRYFNGYSVEVFAGAWDGVGSPPPRLRSTTLLDEGYSYLLDMNRQDSIRQGLGIPTRQLTFSVRQRGRYAEEIIYSEPTYLTVTNPPPAEVTGIEVKEFFQRGRVRFSFAGSGDDKGVEVRVSTNPAFDASAGEGTIVYHGALVNEVYIDVEPGETLYVSIAVFDEFGSDPEGLNWSTVIAVSSQALTLSDLPPESIASIEQTAALVTDLLAVNAELSAQASQLIDIDANIAGHTTQLDGVASFIGTIDGKAVATVDANGHIGGFVVAGGAGGTVDATFLVDSFNIVAPGSNPTPLLTVSAGGGLKVNTAIIGNMTGDEIEGIVVKADKFVGPRFQNATNTSWLDLDTSSFFLE